MGRRTNFRALRILIVGMKPGPARILRTVLGQLNITDVAAPTTSEAALTLLKSQTFDAIFCDEAAQPVMADRFHIAARRTPDVRNHMLPIFLICRSPRRRDIEMARNEGFTDALVAPVCAATVLRKLSGALVQPRSFIVAPDFFGPDRRGKARKPFKGDDRRARNARKVKIAKPVASDELTYL